MTAAEITCAECGCIILPPHGSCPTCADLRLLSVEQGSRPDRSARLAELGERVLGILCEGDGSDESDVELVDSIEAAAKALGLLGKGGAE